VICESIAATQECPDEINVSNGRTAGNIDIAIVEPFPQPAIKVTDEALVERARQ
jgi:hypothetical protein